MKLAAITEMLRMFHAATNAMPERIVLPAVVFDALSTEVASRARFEVTEGIFGYWPIQGHVPDIRLETGFGAVRIQRGS